MLLIAIPLVPLLAGLLCLPVRSPRLLERINLIAFLILAGLGVVLWREVLASGHVEALGGFLYADALSALVTGLLLFVTLACGIYAVGYFRREERDGRVNARQLHRYYFLTPLLAAGMLLVPLANNLGVMWVAMESGTLASVFLITFYNRKTSFEAGWKYIIIGSIGIALALFGTILTYSAAVDVLGNPASGTLNWTALVPLADKFNPPAMRLAFILVLLGYGTKAGLAPMHTWKPDAYEQAPVPTAAMLGAGFINCAVYGIIRFHILAGKCLGAGFSENLLVGFGLGSILLAAPFILVQRNFRRILAYSSIDQAGIMVAALGFGGPLGVLGALLHMVYHALTKPLLFFCTGNVQQRFDTPYFRKVAGVLRVMPWTGALLLLSTLALTGSPPFSLFQSEFIALVGAFQAGRHWAAVLFVLGVVGIFSGFLLQMSRLSLGVPREPLPPDRACPWKAAALGMVTLPVLGLCAGLPGPVLGMVRNAVQIITGH